MIGIRRNKIYPWSVYWCFKGCFEVCSFGRLRLANWKIKKRNKHGYSFWTLWIDSWICLACDLMILISLGYLDANWNERFWSNG